VHIGELAIVVAAQDVAGGDWEIEQAQDVLCLGATHGQPAGEHGRSGVRDAMKFQQPLQATVRAVASAHGQECNVDLGLPQRHVDVAVDEHTAGFVPHLPQGRSHRLSGANRGVAFNGEAAQEDTDLLAGTHVPRVPFIRASVKKTLQTGGDAALPPSPSGLW